MLSHRSWHSWGIYTLSNFGGIGCAYGHITANIKGFCLLPVRTPAHLFQKVLGLPRNCSGSLWRFTTSSGTLRSFWSVQMGSLWWDGLQGRMSPLWRMTSSSTWGRRSYCMVRDQRDVRGEGGKSAALSRIGSFSFKLNQDLNFIWSKEYLDDRMIWKGHWRDCLHTQIV